MKWEVIYELAVTEFGTQTVECTRVTYTDATMFFHVGQDVVAMVALNRLVFARKLDGVRKLAEGGIVKPWHAPESEEEVLVPGKQHERLRVRYRGIDDPLIEATTQDVARRLRPANYPTAGELGENCA